MIIIIIIIIITVSIVIVAISVAVATLAVDILYSIIVSGLETERLPHLR